MSSPLALWIGLLCACRNEMYDQPRYEPMEPSAFFSDGTSARTLVPGTVPRGLARLDAHLYQGLVPPPGAPQAQSMPLRLIAPGAGPGLVTTAEGAPQPRPPEAWNTLAGAPQPPEARAREAAQQRAAGLAETFPYPINLQAMERGRERYDIFCSPCHDRVGTGAGMVARRGFTNPPSLHAPRLLAEPVGHYFQVITNGLGAMPAYAGQIPPRDRWAIIAYIRALQLSQRATLADVPPEALAALRRQLP
jgi:mono/diheme cytochrome c family protein